MDLRRILLRAQRQPLIATTASRSNRKSHVGQRPNLPLARGIALVVLHILE
jgi:hypothetical protein